MQELREIVHVVKSYSIEDGVTFDFMGANGKESLVSRLYNGIADGRYRTDEDAVQELYGKSTVHAAYRQLKARLRRQLLHAVLSLDIKVPKNSELVVARYYSNKNITIANFLITFSARNAGAKLLHKTLKEAERMHLFDIALQCARLLRCHYSLIGLEKQFAKYEKLVSVIMHIQAAEDEADAIEERLKVKYVRSTSKKREFIEFAHALVMRMQELKTSYPTYTVMVNCFRVQAFYYQIASDFYSLIRLCEEVEVYYLQHPHFSTKARLAEFAVLKMAAFLYLRDYQQGEINAQSCMELYPSWSNNWLVFMGLYLLLCLHSQKFIRAAEILQEVRRHPQLQNREDFRIEKWRVYEGYLQYVFESGWEQKPSQKMVMFSKPFKPNKLLNEVSTYSKDKRGMNVSLLVLQMLFFIERGEFEKVIERKETLRRYATRYLLTDATRRSRVFIKLLLLLEQHNFEYARVKKAGARHYQLLCRRDDVYGRADDTEILPFELLWERILLRLNQGATARDDGSEQ